MKNFYLALAIAGAVLPIMAFLCSDDAHYMTGQVFAIDGGILMMR